MEERRGRKKRGRVNWDEEESLGGSKEDNEGREERARQREIMKEMREKRAAEKIVEERFKDDVVAQKLSIKEVTFPNFFYLERILCSFVSR